MVIVQEGYLAVFGTFLLSLTVVLGGGHETRRMLNLMYSTARQFAFLGSVVRIARISSGLANHLGPVIFAISPIVLAFFSLAMGLDHKK